jgi:hypothetical protein
MVGLNPLGLVPHYNSGSNLSDKSIQNLFYEDMP